MVMVMMIISPINSIVVIETTHIRVHVPVRSRSGGGGARGTQHTQDTNRNSSEIQVKFK